MRYRKLPFESQLESVMESQGAGAMVNARAAAFLATATSPGFQLVTGVLRDLERAALAGLRSGRTHPDRAVGHLQCIESIRQSLASLLPEGERSGVDWFDDGEEEYAAILDEKRPVNEEA